jgi:hypothetical protein
MNNKTFFSLTAGLGVLMIALSIVWPQGLGLRSPPPFGHDVVLPDVVRAEREKAERLDKRRRDRAEAEALKASEQAASASVQ